MPGVTNGMEPVKDENAKLSKAAYLMVKGSIAEDLAKKEEFIEALQYAGEFKLI